MEQIGATVVRLFERATDFSMPSTRRPIVGAPSTDEECRALQAWAEALPVERPTPASQNQIERHLAFMAATLPSQAIDDESGRKRFAVYVSLLTGFSDEALAYMARTACQTLRWFPVPVQCLDLAREYRAPVGQCEETLRLCHGFAQASFERWRADVAAGQPVGDVSDQWKRIAVEQGIARRLEDGSYVSRVAYHGPFKAWAA